MFIFKNKFLLALFLLLETLLVVVIYHRQQHITQDFMQLQTATAKGGYESVYKGFQKVSELANSSIAARPELIDLFKEVRQADEEQKKVIRLKMAAFLDTDFQNIQKLQFHDMRFYLPDNDSFLRLNEPELMGDDTSSTLYSVAYVNTHHQPADGFEIGKHASLFRFVYPLFDDGKNYIGCVELSVSPQAFINELERSLQMHLHFIVKDEMLPANKEEYVKSLENDNFSKLLRKKRLPDKETDLLDELLDEDKRAEIDLKMRSDKEFSICLYNNENAKVATFLTVTKDDVQETAAYLVLYKTDLKLMFMGSDYWERVGGFSLVLFVAFLLLSFQTNRKRELTDMLGEKNSELETLNDHLSHLVQERTDALRKESAFIRDVLDALPIYIFWKDLDKKYLGCNALFAKLVGMQSEAEIIGKDDFTFSWRGQASRYRSVDEQVITTGEAQKNYISTLALPEEEMMISISKVPLRDASGEIIGVLGVFVDITALNTLQQEHEKLATVLNLNLNEVYIFDLDDNHAQYANCAAIHSLGYTHDEMRDISLSNLNAGDTETMDSAIQALQEGRTSQKVVIGEHRRKDGTTYPVETHFQRLDIQDKAQLVAISVDISERIAAEEEIQKIYARYELTLAGVGDGIWDWDLVNNTVYFSKRWKEMLGYQEDEIKDGFDEWESRVHPDDIKQAFEDLEANITGKTEQYENLHRLKHRDGHWVWILDRGKTIFDQEGKAVRMLGIHTDVTEKKALEDTMLKNEARLMQAQRIAHLGTWEWDLLKHETTWSDELYRLLGEAPQSFKPTHKTILSYLSGSEKKRYSENLRDVLQNKKMDETYRWDIIRKDGVIRTISATMKISRDAGQIIYIQGTFLDITERKEVEETLSLMNNMLVNSYEKQKLKTEEVSEAKSKLQESHNDMEIAKAEAERASCSKSEFLANMSHEIRTPLNAMNGFISLLKKDENDKAKLKYLEIIEHSSETLLQIINDILDCSKIESGKLEIEMVDFQPKKELYRTAKLFQAKAAEKEIDLDINCHEGVPKVLHGDVLRLKQILSNLLSNAIKFTDRKGEISCRIKYDEGVLSFRVKDSGIGIPEDKLQHVFESFSQADNSIVREYGGTGLGLTISAKLVEMLGGELKVESQLGVGSTFFFSVPISLGQDIDEESEHDKQEPMSLEGHLLVVEDNEANCMFVGIILSGAGLTYETASNGVEAVEKFREGAFDLILMDENMPKLNGIGATKEILQIEEEQGSEHTPIIALTANALVGDRQLFMEAGMDDYLAKPLEPAQLIQKIGSFIGQK